MDYIIILFEIQKYYSNNYSYVYTFFKNDLRPTKKALLGGGQSGEF